MGDFSISSPCCYDIVKSNLVVVHSNAPTRGAFGSDNKDEVNEVFKPFTSADSFGVQTRTCWDATLLDGVLTHPWEWGINFLSF